MQVRGHERAGWGGCEHPLGHKEAAGDKNAPHCLVRPGIEMGGGEKGVC